MPEPGKRAIDQCRVLGRKRSVIEAVFRQRAGLEILHHHMRATRQPLHQRSTLWLRQIDGDGFLVAIGGKKIGGVAGAAVRAIQERRTEAPRLVAFARPFDLDDVRAEIAKNLRRPRSRQHPGKIQHLNMRKRAQAKPL